jgi:hypothetical protein
MLRRGLETHGMKTAPQAEKIIALRVVTQSVQVQSLTRGVDTWPVAVGRTWVNLTLEAQAADGTRVLIDARNSAASAQRAIDSTVHLALTRLLEDEKFLAYMNR